MKRKGRREKEKAEDENTKDLQRVSPWMLADLVHASEEIADGEKNHLKKLKVTVPGVVENN